MELSRIERLLERYDEGETSIAEENELRAYFRNEEIPEHLRSYQLMFTFAAKQSGHKLEETPKMQSAKNWYAWTSIAAILIIAMGLFYFNDVNSSLNDTNLGTLTEEEVALEKAKETLAMVSSIMNEGKSDLAYLKEFNKTKNKIIQID